MKNERWTEDLYLYRMKPAPPKKDDLQEYLFLYYAEKDDKYLQWFFHYYEPRLNTIIMQTEQENAMQGHFADMKQAYIFGIYKALQKYDISAGVPFLIFKEHYVKNEIDKYISTMRTGYSVQSKGKMVYGYMPKKAKNLIDGIVDELAKTSASPNYITCGKL